MEKAGLDLVWVAEAYGIDSPSQMGYLAALTERVEIGSAILPIFTRTPTLIAMTAAGVDALSEGRFHLGLGSSGPQVIEGWHGVPFDAPLGRTREIVDICRTVWAREAPLEHHGRYYDMPLPEGEGTGLGKALKIIGRPGAVPHPDLGRLPRPQERGHDRRDRRRLDPHAVRAGEGPRGLGRVPGGGCRQAGPVARPAADHGGRHGGHRRGRRCRPRCATWPGRWWRCTWAAWAPRGGTSTTTWSAATGTRRRRPRSRTSTSTARRPRPRRSCPTSCSSRCRCADRPATWPSGSPPSRRPGVSHLQVVPVPTGDQTATDVIAQVKEMIG